MKIFDKVEWREGRRFFYVKKNRSIFNLSTMILKQVQSISSRSFPRIKCYFYIDISYFEKSLYLSMFVKEMNDCHINSDDQILSNEQENVFFEHDRDVFRRGGCCHWLLIEGSDCISMLKSSTDEERILWSHHSIFPSVAQAEETARSMIRSPF